MTDDDVTPELARKMHRTMEVVHGIVYFAPEPAEEYAEIGIEGRSGYFASRVAAMGPVSAEVVDATFFNFHPGLVARAMDGVWETTTPEAMLAARERGIDRALRRLLGDAVESDEMVEASELARRAATDLPRSGRTLFAAHDALPWPDAPHLVLWHAQTLIREFRGDGHLAALLCGGVQTGCEALVQHAATGELPAESLRASRSWPQEEWDETVAVLEARGWVDAEGHATPAGAARREQIEQWTDEMALDPWRRIGRTDADRLRALVRPYSRAIVAGGELGRRP